METTHCMLVQFADDLQFIFTGSSNELGKLIENAKNKKQKTLKKVKLYFDKYELKINAKNESYIHRESTKCS